MYSVVRENFYDSGKLSRADKEMKEFHSIHAAQPGYCGNIVVDLEGGHILIVTLWESESTAHAAREALEPDIQRLLDTRTYATRRRFCRPRRRPSLPGVPVLIRVTPLVVQRLSIHPTLWLDLHEPVLCRGNATQIFVDVLFSYVANGNQLPLTIGDGDAKQLFAQENSLSVMPKRSVTDVGKKRFRFIEPVVNRKIILGPAIELPGAPLRVLDWMGHGH